MKKQYVPSQSSDYSGEDLNKSRDKGIMERKEMEQGILKTDPQAEALKKEVDKRVDQERQEIERMYFPGKKR